MTVNHITFEIVVLFAYPSLLYISAATRTEAQSIIRVTVTHGPAAFRYA